MDLKNIIAAIALSAAVIVLYGLFFAPTQEQINNIEKKEELYKILKKYLKNKTSYVLINCCKLLLADNSYIFSND